MTRAWRSTWTLLAAIVVLRAAGFAFGVLNIDESDFLVLGAGIWKGLLPYRDMAEIKPPLGYLTYALAGGSLDILPMRFAGVLWVLATALLLKAAAVEWTRSEEAGWAAAWLSLLAGLVEVPSFGSEVMMNLPVACALYLFARGESFLGGLLFGIASLYRHQAVVAPLAFALALLRERKVLRIGALSLGVLFPWFLVAGFYAQAGSFHDFFEWAFLRNLEYAGKGSSGSALLRGTASLGLCLGAAVFPWALAIRESLRPRDDLFGRALVLLLWLTFLPVAAGGRFYEHYFLQFVPPLALLAAPAAAGVFRRRPWLAAAACAVPLLVNQTFTWARGFAGGYPEQEPRAIAIASFVRAHTTPDETLFVWGHFTPLYTLARRMPGTRYFNTSVHMGNFDPAHLPAGFDPGSFRSERDIAATLRDLETRRPALVIDTAPAGLHDWNKIPLSAFPGLQGYVNEHYRLLPEHPGGAALYRRR